MMEFSLEKWARREIGNARGFIASVPRVKLKLAWTEPPPLAASGRALHAVDDVW